jgi:hypothetical protein
MPTPTIPDGELFFNATLYTGTGATQTITNGVAGQAFQPDLVWTKSRSNAYNNSLIDSVRGVSKGLFSDTTGAEDNAPTAYVTAFNTNGFSVNAGTGSNGNGATYVAWQWKAGGTAVTNTAGTISSQVSANTTSGFSVVTYTGSGAAGTVGHGLGVAPAMIITKKRTNAGGGSAATNWVAWHKSLTGAYSSTTGYIYFNDTSAGATTTNFYDGTAMTSSTFRWQTGNDNINYSNDTFVAYCWAEIAGYSAFGSYVGNSFSAGADGTFVYLGFKPRFVMVKMSSSSGYDWVMYDSARSPTNVTQNYLLANQNYSENAGGLVADIDFLSNGFKLRNNSTSGQGTNIGSQTYIYMAFAENPFKYANAR